MTKRSGSRLTFKSRKGLPDRSLLFADDNCLDVKAGTWEPKLILPPHPGLLSNAQQFVCNSFDRLDKCQKLFGQVDVEGLSQSQWRLPHMGAVPFSI